MWSGWRWWWSFVYLLISVRMWFSVWIIWLFLLRGLSRILLIGCLCLWCVLYFLLRLLC